jgi:hypothetical protein
MMAAWAKFAIDEMSNPRHAKLGRSTIELRPHINDLAWVNLLF